MAAGGLPLVPAGARETGEKILELGRHRRRGDGAGEDPHALAAERLERAQPGSHLAHEGAPRPDPAVVDDRLGALRIVEGEDRGLVEDVRGAEAGRVIRVALDLRRPSHVALGEDAARVAAAGERRGEEERPAGDDVLRLLHVGDDRLGRLLGAAGQTRERERRAQELEEAAAGDTVAPFDGINQLLGRLRGEARKLAMQEILELGRPGELVEAAPELGPALLAQPCADLFEVQAGRLRLPGRFGAAFPFILIQAVHPKARSRSIDPRKINGGTSSSS